VQNFLENFQGGEMVGFLWKEKVFFIGGKARFYNGFKRLGATELQQFCNSN